MYRRPILSYLAMAMAGFLIGAQSMAHADQPTSRLEKYVLTPKSSPKPRINGAKVFGVRPSSPFLFSIPATGVCPMRFAAENLPDGLKLDKNTGRITGKVKQAGAYNVTLRARNKLGEAKRKFRIVVGEKICLTPPMGWNSWNCWAGAVDDKKVRAAAKAMAEKLKNHGWTYVNIDDNWQSRRGGPFDAIQPNEKFPDMKGLCDYVHDLGLKIGIYSTPFVTSYAGCVGGSSDNEDGAWSRSEYGGANRRIHRRCGKYSFAKNDVKQWAGWGIDYLKYDWHPNDVPHVKEMADLLKTSGRDIVYSISNSAPYGKAAEWARLCNCWRTTGDITDKWNSMARIGFQQDRWGKFTGPGHWNDPDMLVVGKLGWGPKLRPSRLTPDEQYTHISLWCLLSAPLLIGCDLAALDEFTLNLLTNDEVLEVNQDPLGRQAGRVMEDGDGEVWAKDMEDGSKAAGLFNRGSTEAKVRIQWSKLGIKGPHTVRDLWRQKDLGVFKDRFESDVPSHGVVLVRIAPVKTK